LYNNNSSEYDARSWSSSRDLAFPRVPLLLLRVFVFGFCAGEQLAGGAIFERNGWGAKCRWEGDD
jgi:hypothetical protein